ncbi:hypothetical protein CQ059_01275 [Brucella pseudogrignonensis]|uniref:hypothetical protein n=1 Tax=Brucella pseudogrignonensis TaxID=419475 RepID=UPI000CFB0959|nr:hypothetical protein [Brucella pseudogrignonensis]PQZ42629.1 hypothetical protein CQ059_01275 [Brucella pseudogrignonensis]PRA42058.1 hypothetical protein CQ063_08640 [Brucella pseudogrignonensis]PRA70516.1 hypothetical protein CQ055_06360 [Brucella pseudogrignonensis]
METFGVTFRKLVKAMNEYPPDARRKPLGPDKVALKSIRRVPTLFAARSSGRATDTGGYQEQAHELHRVLRAMPKDARYFDPITVFEIVGQDYCVDGHHRIAAYYAAEITGKVPVLRIGGTLSAAIEAGIKSNSKTVLPMTLEERKEAAWKLVRIGHGTKEQQALWTGTSSRTIARLRSLKKQLEEKHPVDDWGCVWEARKLLEENEGTQKEWGEDDLAAEVEDYVKRLRKAFYHKLHTRLPAIVQALAEVTSGAAIVDALNETEVIGEVIKWDDESGRWAETEEEF